MSEMNRFTKGQFTELTAAERARQALLRARQHQRAAWIWPHRGVYQRLPQLAGQDNF